MFNLKKVVSVLSAFAVVLLSLFSTHSFAESGSIAVVDIELAVLQTDAAKKSFEGFKKQKAFSDDLKSLESDQKAYKKARENFEKNRAVMSETKRNEAFLELRSMEEDIQHIGTKVQKASQAFQQQTIQRFAEDALKITENIVKEQSIGLLLGKQPGVVLHATPDYDITNLVTERLNQIK